MDKSSKSATKVDAENEIGKAVSAQKRKIEEAVAAAMKKVVDAAMKKADKSDDSEYETSSEEDEPAKARNEKAEKKTPGRQTTTTSSKTLFAGNLSFRVFKSDVEDFFKDVGQVVDVRFAGDSEGQFRGYGHVDFATAEAANKALELNGEELLGLPVRLDLAREIRSAYTRKESSNDSSSYLRTIAVRGFDTSLHQDEIRNLLRNHFGSCGEIRRVSVPMDYETGACKGMAYLDFTDAESFRKALELHQTDLGGVNYLTLQTR